MVEEITDLAEERRKRGKDGDEFDYRFVCPDCKGEVWFVFESRALECVTCGLVPEDIQVTRQ